MTTKKEFSLESSIKVSESYHSEFIFKKSHSNCLILHLRISPFMEMEGVGKDQHLDNIEDFGDGWLRATFPNVELSFAILLEKDKLILCGPNSRAQIDVQKSIIEKVAENVIVLRIRNEDSKHGELPIIKYRGYLCNSNYDGSCNDTNGVLEYVNAKTQICFYVAALTFCGFFKKWQMKVEPQMTAQIEGQRLRGSFSRWLNSFIRCDYKCALKEGHIDDLHSPLMWESFAKIAIFLLDLLNEKCKNIQDDEQDMVLEHIKHIEYIPVDAIVDLHGVAPSKLDFILGKQYYTPPPPSTTSAKAKAVTSKVLKRLLTYDSDTEEETVKDK